MAGIVITGTAASDILTGQQNSADTLYGLDGNDQLYAGYSPNAIGSFLYGGAGRDDLAGSYGNDWLDGGTEDDTIYGAEGNDTLLGGAGNDSLNGYFGDDSIDGGTGNDSIDGGLGADTLLGGDGNDTIDGSLGNDLVDGGNGDDSITANDTADTVHGGAGNDTLYSFQGKNQLYGDAGNDTFDLSSSFAETIVGGAGDDSIQSLYGGSTYRMGQGDGHDTLTVWRDQAVSVLQLGAGITLADLQLSLDQRDLIVSWDHGASSARLINYIDEDLVTPLPFNIQLSTGALVSTAATLARVNVNSTDLPDALLGDALGNTIQAGAGDDVIQGREGNDLIEGQQGRDLIYGGTGNDTLRGGWNSDTLYGDAGNNLLDGGQGFDSLQGGDGDDTLIGGDGDDTLRSGLGTNVLMGGLGWDVMSGVVGSHNTYIGGEGNDRIVDEGGGGTFVLGRNAGFDAVTLYAPSRAGDLNTVQLESGITPADLQAIVNLNGDLILNLRDGSAGMQLGSGPGATPGKLDRIVFADGTTWDRTAIAAHTREGTAGDDSIRDTLGTGSFLGQGGNDYLLGMGGDTLDGGTGNDTLSVMATTKAGLLIGGDGNDRLEGGDGPDTLSGGKDADTLLGGAGKDTYLFNLGDGHDLISDSDWGAFNTNRTQINAGGLVRLGAGINTSNITLIAAGNDLLIKTGQDRLTIENFYKLLPDANCIFFADGSALTKAQIQARATVVSADAFSGTGTSGNDSVNAGYASSYTYDAGSGNDTLNAGQAPYAYLTGGAGNDTYLWGLDSGTASITSGVATGQQGGNVDVIQLGAGITPAMVTLQPYYTQGLGFEIYLPGQSNTLRSYSTDASSPLADQPIIRFADGSTWDHAAMLSAMQRTTPDLARFYAGGNDTFNGSANSYGEVFGGAGSDTFVIGHGSAIHHILPTSAVPYATTGVFGAAPLPSPLDVDTLQLTGGIRPQDVMLQMSPGASDATLTLRNTDDVSLVLDQVGNTADSEVDRVVFDDGTVWRASDLLNLGSHSSPDGLNLLGGNGNELIEGEDGFDWLAGGAGKDTLNGGAGRDTLLGGQGDDSYVVDRSDDVVTEQPGEGKDIVRSSADYTAPDNVETLVLTGTANLRATAQATVGTTLIGNEGNNLLTGGTGGDTLSGNGGADTLIGGSGSDYYYLLDDADTIVEQPDDEGLDVIFAVTDSTAMASNVEVLFMKSPLATSATGSADDNAMYASQTAVSFDGQAGNDLLMGSKAGDTLIGGLGDDELNGGKGNDLYTHRAGDGFDTLIDNDATAGNSDTLSWEGVSADQLWLSRAGNDLQIQVLGGADGVRVNNWFQGSNNQIERITVGTQTLTNDRVQALVQQMSAFSPPAAGIGSLQPADQATLHAALNNAWQG